MKTFFKSIIRFFLEWEARAILAKYKPSIVAITGSVGKTSTKDAVDAVLSTGYFVRKSPKTFNSDIGVPLTILGRPNAWENAWLWLKNLGDGLLTILLPSSYPRWLVLEIGIDRPGDMLRIVRWIVPDVVVVTRFPNVPTHVEFFITPKQLIEEKKLLVSALKPGGTLVLNYDDERIRPLRNEGAGKSLTYGFEMGADFRASNVVYTYQNGYVTGMSFRVNHDGKSVPVLLQGVLGKHLVYAMLAALAVGSSQGLNLLSMGEALGRMSHPGGRMRLLRGIHESQIIDDSYNASPTAAEEALATLKNIETKGKKIAVLADMLELGSFTQEEHRRIGLQAAASADMLITVGVRSSATAGAARDAGMGNDRVFEALSAEEAGKTLQKILGEGDAVLVKGSQSMRMERAVAMVLEHKEDAKFLVRQEAEWRKR